MGLAPLPCISRMKLSNAGDEFAGIDLVGLWGSGGDGVLGPFTVDTIVCVNVTVFRGCSTNLGDFAN